MLNAFLLDPRYTLVVSTTGLENGNEGLEVTYVDCAENPRAINIYLKTS